MLRDLRLNLIFFPQQGVRIWVWRRILILQNLPVSTVVWGYRFQYVPRTSLLWTDCTTGTFCILYLYICTHHNMESEITPCTHVPKGSFALYSFKSQKAPLPEKVQTLCCSISDLTLKQVLLLYKVSKSDSAFCLRYKTKGCMFSCLTREYHYIG